MFGFFKKEKRVEKVDLGQVCAKLSRLFWEFELVDGKPDVVVIKGKYRNHQRDYHRLFIHFMGDKVQFKDERGRSITHVPSFVERNNLFPVLKDIMNVL